MRCMHEILRLTLCLPVTVVYNTHCTGYCIPQCNALIALSLLDLLHTDYYCSKLVFHSEHKNL